MDKIHISKEKKSLTKNFNSSEFYFGLDFDLPKSLVDGAQFLREYFNKPIKITSTFRPKDLFGFHRYGEAIDLIWFDDNYNKFNIFKNECKNHKTSEMFKGLRKCGIDGFGLENSCIHLDIRPDLYCHLTDEIGKYCIFTWVSTPLPYGTSGLIY